MTTTVMRIENVYRVKGTQVVGRLWCDVRVGDLVIVGGREVPISGIENYAKPRDSAKENEVVILTFEGVSDVEIAFGSDVTKKVVR